MTTVLLAGIVVLALAFFGLWLSRSGHHRTLRIGSVGLVIVGAFLIYSTTWPLDMLWPMSRQRVSTTIPGYRVEFIQTTQRLMYLTTVELIRPDGKRAEFFLDSDVDRCGSMGIWQDGSALRFLCSDKPFSGYLDLERLEFHGPRCALTPCKVEDALFQ